MIKRNVSTPPKENGEYFCYDNYGNKRVVSFKNGGWLTSDRNNIVSWVDETHVPPKPSVLDFTGHIDITAEECNAAPLLCRYARALENYIKENITT